MEENNFTHKEQPQNMSTVKCFMNDIKSCVYEAHTTHQVHCAVCIHIQLYNFYM